ICAMWGVDLARSGLTPVQLYISAGAGLFLGIYAFTLPPCAPVPNTTKRSFASSPGLDAFILFHNRKMLIFFIFSMLLGFSLQISNAFADGFINDFAKIPQYAESFGV